MSGCAKAENEKLLNVSIQSGQVLNEFSSLSPFPTLLLQITDLRSEHGVCAQVTRR